MVFFLLIPLLLNGCANTDVLKTTAHEKSTSMRNDSKWDRAKSFQLEKYHMIVGILNDNNNLYIRVATTDSSIQQGIMTFGCTIWVNACVAARKKYMVFFTHP